MAGTGRYLISQLYSFHIVNIFEQYFFTLLQACTEMVMPMSSSKDSSMFPEYDFDYAAYEDQCVQLYGVKPRPQWITTEFGGHVSQLI